jgi:hypothetical protein
MEGSSATEAIAILEDCGHQQELIDIINGQSDAGKKEQLCQ